jgi:hypothetical protein
MARNKFVKSDFVALLKMLKESIKQGKSMKVGLLVVVGN